MPRIIAGSKKGIILFAPKSDKVRPTSDRTKESLFSIIYSRYTLEGIKVLDLFSGTGAFGLECISRGADSAVFVDKDTRYIKENVEKCGLKEQSEIIKKDALSAIKQMADEKKQFDLIFMDPPYDRGLYEKIIENPLLYDIIANNGVIIVELSSKEQLVMQSGPLSLRDVRKYGICVFAFYEKEYYENMGMPGKL